jgi:hypothetical protein
MAKFLKENFDKKETFVFGSGSTSIFEEKKHAYSDGGISVFAISIHSINRAPTPNMPKGSSVTPLS